MKQKNKLTAGKEGELLLILENRFKKNMHRHRGLEWHEILNRILEDKSKLRSLNEMERTGGEPDVIGFDKKSNQFLYADCSVESPSGRRSLCYDEQALKERKEHKPAGSAIGMAAEMGIELMTEEEYRWLQQHGKFDTKTSSWIKTPDDIRKAGGSLFGDFRYGHVFIYHNGAQSYYAARGLRGILRL